MDLRCIRGIFPLNHLVGAQHRIGWFEHCCGISDSVMPTLGVYYNCLADSIILLVVVCGKGMDVILPAERTR